jgi:hypothetical protein
MSIGGQINAWGATFSFILFFIFILLTSVQNSSKQNESNVIMKFDDEVDHFDIHRLQNMKDHQDYYTANCTAGSMGRDTDKDGVDDCKDEFPLWPLATKIAENGYPDCSCLNNNEDNSSLPPKFRCGILHSDKHEQQYQCNNFISKSTDDISFTDGGIDSFKYYYQGIDDAETSQNAECVSIHEATLAFGYQCDGDTTSLDGNQKFTKDSDGHYTPEGLHCIALQCCAILNDQKAAGPGTFSDEFDTKTECNNDFDFHALYTTNRTDFDPSQNFRAETTMSMTDFCSYTESPARTDTTSEKKCIKIADALTFFNHKEPKNMNKGLKKDQTFAIWWNTHWVLLGLSAVHFLLIIIPNFVGANFGYFWDIGEYFYPQNGTGAKWIRAFNMLAVVCVIVASGMCFVTFLMFMGGDHDKDTDTYGIQISESRGNLTVGNQQSYQAFEFFDHDQKDTCPTGTKNGNALTEDECIILSNVQHHVFGDNSKEDRWMMWGVFLVVAYFLQFVAASVYFVFIAYQYRSNGPPKWVNNDNSQNNPFVKPGFQAKVGSSTSTPTTGTQTQKRVVSAYASGKIKNGSMKF